jgi:nucleoid DNA-binding protein
MFEKWKDRLEKYGITKDEFFDIHYYNDVRRKGLGENISLNNSSKELRRRLNKRLGLSDYQTRHIINILVDELTKMMKEGYYVRIPRFGTFFLRNSKRMIGYDMKKRKTSMIGGKYWKAFFSASSRLGQYFNSDMNSIHDNKEPCYEIKLEHISEDSIKRNLEFRRKDGYGSNGCGSSNNADLSKKQDS